MSITQTNMIAKIAAVVAGLGLVAMSFASFAVPAQAAEVMTTTTTTTTTTTFARDLTIGSTGADVTALQSWLIGKGFSIPAGATGYFGAQTRAAVSAYQAANGISPTAGYFGPKTRAMVNAAAGGSTVSTVPGCTAGAAFSSTTGQACGSSTTTTTTSSLSGGAGKLKNVDSLGDVESDLKEGDSATKVLGFSADAQDSDVAVQRVDVTLSIAAGSGSASANKYVDTVSLYQDGKKLASMDASAGDKNGRVWTYRFSDVNGVIREGKTGNFYVEVTPVSSVGSSESAVVLTAAIPTDGIRAVDAEGVSETYSVTGGSSETFAVSTATDGTLTINEGSSNPKSSTVKADANNTTEDITLLSFNLKAKNQDVTVHDLPVVVATNSGGILSDYVQSVKLMKGSTVLKSKSATSTGVSQTFTFDNIDQDISKDDTSTYSVVVAVRKIDASGSTFTSGDTLMATVSGAGAWDVEDANGSSVTPTGSLVGNAVTFQQTGITVTKTDASYSKTVGQNANEGDKVQYSISFKVTAGDDDLFIKNAVTNLGSTSPSAVTTSGGVQYATTTSSTASTTSATNLSVADFNSSDTSSYFKVPSGTTRTFTLNVTLTETGATGSTGYAGVQLVGFDYGTSTAAITTKYTSGLDTFKTADVSMSVH
ncbi:MAG: Penicillin-resistant dd-carboxypeptidase-like protein [Parcubacteria group bacterium]|nr:Penicillin-resistant dd-carboxypeptidase-like protein [Parcubacteria group bacterium]